MVYFFVLKASSSDNTDKISIEWDFSEEDCGSMTLSINAKGYLVDKEGKFVTSTNKAEAKGFLRLLQKCHPDMEFEGEENDESSTITHFFLKRKIITSLKDYSFTIVTSESDFSTEGSNSEEEDDWEDELADVPEVDYKPTDGDKTCVQVSDGTLPIIAVTWRLVNGEEVIIGEGGFLFRKDDKKLLVIDYNDSTINDIERSFGQNSVLIYYKPNDKVPQEFVGKLESQEPYNSETCKIMATKNIPSSISYIDEAGLHLINSTGYLIGEKGRPMKTSKMEAKRIISAINLPQYGFHIVEDGEVADGPRIVNKELPAFFETAEGIDYLIEEVKNRSSKLDNTYWAKNREVKELSLKIGEADARIYMIQTMHKSSGKKNK